MDLIAEPTVGMLGTVAGLGFLVSIVTEIILRAINPTSAWKDRFGPLLALLVATVFAVVGALAQGLDVVTAILLAVVTAGTGMGIHDTVTSQVSS